uniref:RAP domain-containing protein n=1 Tax=Hanusia phi TaxID=3032 RepID=A0A7S0HZ93_9CRYP
MNRTSQTMLPLLRRAVRSMSTDLRRPSVNHSRRHAVKKRMRLPVVVVANDKEPPTDKFIEKPTTLDAMSRSKSSQLPVDSNALINAFHSMKVPTAFSLLQQLVVDKDSSPNFDTQSMGEGDKDKDVVSRKLPKVTKDSADKVFDLLCKRLLEESQHISISELASILQVSGSINRHLSPRILQKMWEKLRLHQDDVSSQNLAFILESLTVVRAQPPEDVVKFLLTKVGEDFSRFSSPECCSVLWAVSLLELSDDQERAVLISHSLLRSLFETALKHLGDLAGKDLCRLLWSIAIFEFKLPPGKLDEISRGLLQNVNELNSSEISSIFVSYALLSARMPKDLCLVLSERAAANIESFNLRDMTDILWSHGLLQNEPDDYLYIRLSARALSCVQAFQAQDMSDFLWSHAILGKALAPVLAARLLAHINVISHSLSAHNVACILWALANLRIKMSSTFFKIICQRIISILQDFGAHELSESVWSMAILYRTSPVEDRIEARLVDVEVQQPQNRILLSNQMLGDEQRLNHNRQNQQTLSNANSVRTILHNTCQKMCLEAISKIDQFSVTSISNFLWGMTSLSETLPPGQLEMFLGKTDGIDIYKQDATLLLWSAAILQPRISHQLLANIIRCLQIKLRSNGLDKTRGSSMWKQGGMTSMMCWGIAVLRIEDKSLIESIVRDIKHLTPDFQEMDLSLLHIFFLSCSLDQKLKRVTESISEMPLVRSGLQEKARASFLKVNLRPSKLRKQIAQTFSRTGIPCIEGRVDADSGYRLDILLLQGSQPGDQYAVEVHDRNCFLSDRKTLKAAMLLRWRHLAALGYHLIAIPYWEWEEILSKSAGEEETDGQLLGASEYLLSKLASCGSAEYVLVD